MRSIILFAFILLSCNNNSNQKDIKDQPNTDSEQNKENINDKENDKSNSISSQQCYWQIMKRDTFVAKLVHSGSIISGKLSFDNYQKDGSTGTVKGVLDGDVYKLWYSFQSEGMHSVMEVWYKKQGDALLRAIGPVDVKGDTSYFTNKTAITYDPSQKLEKTDCSDIAAKYK